MTDFSDALEARRREVQNKRKAAKKKRRIAALKRILLLFVIAVIITLVILSLTVFFPIKSISVKGDVPYTSQQIISASGIESGKNIFMSGINADSKIPVDLPYISSAKIERKFPSTVVINVKKAKAEYCYEVKGGYLLCDSEKKILEKVKSPANDTMLIVGSSVKADKAGKKLSFAEAEKSELIDRLEKSFEDSGISVTAIDITEIVSMKITVENRLTVKLGSSAYLEAKISHLVGMMQNIEKDRKGRIDLSDYSPENPTGILTRE